jgi:hypothetical protein
LAGIPHTPPGVAARPERNTLEGAGAFRPKLASTHACAMRYGPSGSSKKAGVFRFGTVLVVRALLEKVTGESPPGSVYPTSILGHLETAQDG